MKNRKEQSEVNGYIVVYKPDHPNAMKGSWEGYVYEHVIVASLILGRPLNDEELEQVHHLNFNRQDNRPKNIIIITKGMHTRLHNWIDEYSLQHFIMEHSTQGHHVYKCLNCGEYLLEDKKYCNGECRKEYRIKQIPVSKDELEGMLSNIPKLHIANMYEATINNVNSWIRDYEIDFAQIKGGIVNI